MRGGECTRAFASAFVRHRSVEQVVAAVVLFASGALAQILLSAKADKLASLDRGIAAWAQSLFGDTDNEFATGLVHFLNELLGVLVIIYCAVLVFVVLYDLLILKLHLKAYLEHYLYIVVGIAVTLVLSFGTLCIMKTAFNRPRPWQTEEFHRLDATDVECWAKFWPAYRVFPEQEKCSNYEYASCPSGHTLTVVIMGFLASYLSYYNLLVTKKIQRLTKFSTVLWSVITVCCVVCTAIFVPTVMVARMSALMHYFTDVTGGLGLALTYASLLVFFRPYLPSVVS